MEKYKEPLLYSSHRTVSFRSAVLSEKIERLEATGYDILAKQGLRGHR